MKLIDRLTSWRYLTPIKEGPLLVIIGDGITDDFISRAIPPDMRVIKLYLQETRKKKRGNFNIGLKDNSVGKAIILGTLGNIYNNDFFEELYRVLVEGAGVCFFESQRSPFFTLKKFLNIYNFKSARVYGVFPDFSYPRWIIPLRTKHFISSTRGIFKPVKLIKRISWELIVPFSFIKLHHLLFKNNFLIVEKESKLCDNRSENFRVLLQNLFKQKHLELALLNRPRKYYLKTNAQVMDEEGSIIAYVKIGDTPQVKELIRNEYEVLNRLEKLNIQSADISIVEYFDEGEKFTIMVQRAKSSLSPGPISISDEHILFLAEIFTKTSKICKFEESPLFFNIRQNLKDLEGNIEYKWYHLLELALSKIYERFKDKRIPIGLAHWDFAPWNTCWKNKGRLVVFDWELANFNEPPLIDFYHFVVRVEGVVRSRKTQEILFKLINDEGFYFELINNYKTVLGYEEIFDKVGFLLIYLYKASSLYLSFEKLKKQVGFTDNHKTQLLGVLQPMLEEVVKLV